MGNARAWAEWAASVDVPHGGSEAVDSSQAWGADEVRVDWLTVSVAGAIERHALRRCLHGDVIEDHSIARKRGYLTGLRDEDGAHYMERPDGASIDWSGGALSRRRGRERIAHLIWTLKELGARCSRIDVARDHQGDWTPARLLDAFRFDRLLSGFRGGRGGREPWHAQLDGLHVESMNGGRKGRGVYLRVYDKVRELHQKGLPCPFERLTRWEFALSREWAREAFDSIASGAAAGDVHGGVLRGFPVVVTLDPIDRENGHQGRAEADPEWLAFVQDGDAIKRPKPEHRELMQGDAAAAYLRASWFASQCGPSAAALRQVLGEEKFRELLDCQAAQAAAGGKLAWAFERSDDNVRAAVLAGWLGLDPSDARRRVLEQRERHAPGEE